MSDATSLSSNYSATAAFAKDFNSAVLVLKRRYLAPESTPSPAADEEAAARKKLADYLRGVVSQLADETGAAAPAERVPDGVISRLAEKNQNKMTWFVSDLRQAEDSLRGSATLGQDDFAALDEVCDAADATASASFRRLWRR